MDEPKPSPFPGMDPYTERLWSYLRIGLNVYASGLLNTQLPRRLVSRVGYRDSHPPGEHRGIEPTRPSESFVRILDVDRGSRIVTILHFATQEIRTIESVRQDYTAWRDGWRELGVGFVEVNLLRAGMWSSMVPHGRVPEWPGVTVYHAVADCRDDRHTLAFWGFAIDKRLPSIPIPLRKGDRDVPLDLQQLIGKSYLSAGCDLDVDYTADADPPLTGDAAAWADALLRKAGRRPAVT